LTPWLLLLVLGEATPAAPDVPPHVYYNARMALREARPKEALKLWFLRNTVASEHGTVSAWDEHFVSVTWMALGDLGLCQDGLRYDTGGAGVWPVALHNWFVRNRRKKEYPDQPAPFDAFELARQQRKINIHDVLNAEELRKIRFFRSKCLRMQDVMVEADGSMFDDASEIGLALDVMSSLLAKSLRTVSSEHVRGVSAIEARMLDVRLRKIEHVAKLRRREARKRRRRTKQLKLAPGPSIDVVRAQQMGELLAITEGWTVDDWMVIDPKRRVFLYDQAREATETDAHHRQIQLGVIDRLITRKSGQELRAWIAWLSEDESAWPLVWSGDRGKALLGLERDTEFRERSAIALHRGVDFLGSGQLDQALRSFAYALHHADESTSSESIRGLSLRWLSYVASRFEVTDELVTMLVALVPRADLGQILEDLLWTAAFSADAASFDRILGAHRGRGAMRRRAARLRSLADGDTGKFLTAMRDELLDAPHTGLRFVRRFFQRLQTQDGDVRLAHRETLRSIREILNAARPESERRGSLPRKLGEMDEIAASMLDGLPAIESDESARDRARGLAPSTEVFAGNIRLAPSDPLPWPFPIPTGLRAPSVFTPLPAVPVEWRRDGGLVMGWKLGL